MKKGILFDLDGTLWDSSKEVVESWLLAWKDCLDIKRQLSIKDMQQVMGKTMTEIADLLFAEVPKERRMEILNHCVTVENEYIEKNGGRLFEGAEETLRKRKQSYHLYIVSNCQEGYIEAFLKYHKLSGCFDDFESYGATRRPKGENIRLVAERNQLEAAVYVGDTQGDYEAALSAGMPFIHARTGYGSIAGEVPYVKCLPELFERVPQLIGK